MNISGHSEKLIEEISNFAERPLKNLFEVSVLIECTFKTDRNLFMDLIFNAKYVSGLKNVLSNRSINRDDYMEKLFEEFNKALERFIYLLKEVVLRADDPDINFFNEKYFRLTQDSMVSVMELIGDLTIVKEYFNSNPKEISK